MKPLRPQLFNQAASSRKSALGWVNSGVYRGAFLGALAGAMLAFVLNLPALWVARGLSAASSGQVQLLATKGSVWTGSGQLVLTGGAGSLDALALPGRLQWHLNFALSESHAPILNLKVQASCCMSQAVKLEIRPLQFLSTWQIKVEDHQSNWPAQWLSGLGAPWNTLQPEGALVLKTQQLVLELSQQNIHVLGNLSLTALDLSSKLSTLKPMGTYQLSLAGNATHAAGPSLSLSTQSGSLLLNGTGQWQGSHFQFRGEAAAVPEHAAALSNLLNIIGRRQGARSLLSLG
jgi:general secretion pathway protein N